MTATPLPAELAALPACLTPRQVADYLQIHQNRAYELLNTGELPGRKVGGQWRIPRHQFWEYLNTPTPPQESEFAKYAPQPRGRK